MSDVIDVFKNMKKHILAGVGYLIPVIVAGGIFCGLGVAIGGTAPWEAPGTLGNFFFSLGKVGLNLMPAVISTFIAMSIADKAAVGPALIIGQLSQDCGAGFIGGLIGGFFIGIVVLLLKKVKVSKTFTALYSFIIIPVTATLLGAVLIQYGIGNLITAFTAWMTSFFENLGTSNLVLVAIIFGVAATFDLGLFGSKAAGVLTAALLAQMDPATGLPIMIGQRLSLTLVTACCLPPLIVAVTTIVRPKYFTDSERESGKAALFLGLCGITEGAIPVCLAHGKVYLGCIIGGTAGAVAQILLGAGSIVNWPGLPNLAGTTGIPQWFIAHGIGLAVGVLFCAFALKTEKPAQSNEEEKDAQITQTGEEYTLDF